MSKPSNNICAKDEQGNAKDRKTGIGETKTTFSVRDILVTDIFLETLKQWKDKQNERQQTKPDVTAILTSPASFKLLMMMVVIEQACCSLQ